MGLSVPPHGQPERRPPPGPPTEPAAGALAIRVEEKDGTLRLRMTGELDWGSIGRVERALKRISEAPIKRVVFDLTQLEFLDSAGLRTILRANERARAGEFELVVVRPRGLASRVFTLTRASKQLTLVDAT